jgi:hypothetical protein
MIAGSTSAAFAVRALEHTPGARAIAARLLRFLFFLLAVQTVQAAQTDERWQYRGIHLGARMTQDQIMAALGVTKYAKNPDIDVWNNHLGCADEAKAKTQVCKDAPFYKHGGLRASEWVENEIGPYCEQDKQPDSFVCENMQMTGTLPDWLTTGHGVVSVYVHVRNGVVSVIDVGFDYINSDDFFEVAERQLGPDGWHTEREKPLIVVNWDDPKKYKAMERITKTKKTKLYGAMMTDIDMTISHAVLPNYRGVLEMKILDQTL